MLMFCLGFLQLCEKDCPVIFLPCGILSKCWYQVMLASLKENLLFDRVCWHMVSSFTINVW